MFVNTTLVSNLCSIIYFVFFFSSRRRHTRSLCDWSSDVCSSDLCEKASALLLARGFSEVYHLKGGILSYLEEIPEAESLRSEERRVGKECRSRWWAYP